MKKILPLIAAAGLALFPISSTYASLDSNLVPADARWVVHVDLDTLRHSVLGQELLDAFAKKHPLNATAGVQIDAQKLLATIGQATAYGANFTHDPKQIDGTIVIEGTSDLRKIAEAFIAQSQLSEPDRFLDVKDLPFEAYSIGGEVFIGFPKEPIIIVSKLKPALVKAYRLYRHDGASLAKAKDSTLRNLIPPSQDAFIVAASVVPPEGAGAGEGPQARLIKMADAGSVAIGEKDKLAFAHVRLVAKSEEIADKLAKIVQGVTAMASLANTNDKQLNEFLQSATVERQGLGVALNLSYSSERLAEMIKQMEQTHENLVGDNTMGVSGKVIAEWTADQDLGSTEPDEKTLTTRKFENVHLSSGGIISILGRPDAGEHARVDYIAVQAADGATPPLKFEAEYMKLSGGYRIEKVAAASGGKVIKTDTIPGVAELQFPGATGDYTLTVAYSDETDGKSHFVLSVAEPAAETKE